MNAAADMLSLQTLGRADLAVEPVRNSILLALPPAEFAAIQPHVLPVTTPHGIDLQQAYEGCAYFPNDGVVSLIVFTQDGHSVEVGLFGREGMAGLASVVGLSECTHRAIVQIPGSGFKVPIDVLRRVLPSAPQLQIQIQRYAVLSSMLLAQSAACNRLHELEQRLAKWLLMCRDRMDSDSLPMTHEFLSTLLGANRPSVTLAASCLRSSQAIEYNRGVVHITDRARLLNSCCECYGKLQQLHADLGLKPYSTGPQIVKTSAGQP